MDLSTSIHVQSVYQQFSKVYEEITLNRMFLYIGFMHIFHNPLYFMSRCIEDKGERMLYYKRMLDLMPAEEKKQLEEKYMM